jgi:hypothetical protein
VSPVPVVLRQHAQPITEGGPRAEEDATNAVFKLQQVGFFAHTLEGKPRTFTVLADEEGVEPTEGWAKLQKVQRFQRVSLTVPEGYDPYAITVPILFDGIARVQRSVEADIETLEWMAGRPAHGEAKGPPPQVSVFSTDHQGNLTNFVPKQFQTVHGASQQWYITGITFDGSSAGLARAGEPFARRTGISVGDRIRQAAVVTLTEIVVTSSAIQEERKAREEAKGRFETIYTNSTANTIRKLAASIGSPESWDEILAANRGVTTSPDRKLRNHTKIKVPLTVYYQVAR